jgi:uncharacterized membrane protein (DUF485 family)
MVHGPPTELKKDNSEGYKTKLGIIMFVVYTVMYMAFVILCVVSPKTVAMKVGGLNLAVAIGFFLILIAIIQAVIYNLMCSKREHDYDDQDGAKDKVNK